MTLLADTGLRRTAWRIGIQTATLLMVSLLVVTAVVYATVLRSQHQAVAEALAQGLAQVKDNGDFDRDHDNDIGRPDASIRVAVLSADGLRVSVDTPAGLPDRMVLDQVLGNGLTDRRTVQVASGRYALLTEKRGDQAVQVMYSLFGQHQERERILGALAVAGAVGLLLSTVLGAWLARRAVRPMSEALTLQRRFVADAGHELRTPLTLLSTRAQLLRRRLTARPGLDNLTKASTLEDQIVHDIDGIVADTRTLTEILEELLLAADTRTPTPDQFVNLTGVAEAAVAAAQATASHRSITLTLKGDDSEVFTAGDPVALTRVVTALVDNALSHAETRVDVNVAQTKKSVSVQVRDDGPGIAETVIPTMFNRFASDRRTGEGDTAQRHYGLGLALVNEIVSRHGGTVTAVNQRPPSHGACLTIALPTREPTPAGRLTPR